MSEKKLVWRVESEKASLLVDGEYKWEIRWSTGGNGFYVSPTVG